MINFEAYMLQDKNTQRWHNYGGLTEWLPDSDKGGTVWHDKEKAQAFADDYNKSTHLHGVIVEVVPVVVLSKIIDNDKKTKLSNGLAEGDIAYHYQGPNHSYSQVVTIVKIESTGNGPNVLVQTHEEFPRTMHMWGCNVVPLTDGLRLLICQTELLQQQIQLIKKLVHWPSPFL